MDVHGNPEDRDAFGNQKKDVWGNPDRAGVHGDRPKDVWGNSVSDRDREQPSGTRGGLIDNLWNKLFGR